MTRKWLMEVQPKNIPDLEEPWPIFLLTKATKITRGLVIYVSNSPPGFVLQTDLPFYNVQSIRLFTSTFVAICSDTSRPFGFLPGIKHPPFDILKLLVTALSNNDKNVVLIRVDEDGALAIYYEFMKTCNNMDVIVQTTGIDDFHSTVKAKYQIKHLLIPQ